MTFEKKLHIRYVIALLLIALVLSFTYFFMIFQIKHNENDGYIINISGMQRMLSQRIALLAYEVNMSDTTDEAEGYIQNMRKALSTMTDNHRELTQDASKDTRDEAIRRFYYVEPNINNQIIEYINISTAFLNKYEALGLEAVRNSDEVKSIANIAQSDLLNHLNSAVSLYQQENKASIEQFKVMERNFYILGLALLLLEIIFIFYPMVKNIVINTRKLKTANNELTEFSYRISHDLRAPIVSSLGLVDVTKMFIEQDNKDEAYEALDHMKLALVRLEELIDDVINLTKMKSVMIEKQDVDVSNMIDHALEKLSFMVNVKEIDISTQIEGIEKLHIKPLFLKQSIENILSNAIKYYDPKKSNPNIRIRVYKENNYCKISIKDNGIGFPKDYYDKVFGMFKRFHPDVSFGSGLGLYLVKQNMEELGGEILFIPHDVGTEFILSVPIR